MHAACDILYFYVKLNDVDNKEYINEEVHRGHKGMAIRNQGEGRDLFSNFKSFETLYNKIAEDDKR